MASTAEGLSGAIAVDFGKTCIRGIVFDMDGLLLDTERLYMRAYQQACHESGVELKDETYFDMIGHRADTSHAILRRAIGADAPINVIIDASRRYYYNYIEHDGIPLLKGAEDLVKYFAKKGLPMAIATSTFYDLACNKLDLVNLRRYFVDIVSGDRVTHGKPKPEIYLKACKLLELPPTECLALEDSPTGLRAAHSAGLATVLVPDLKPSTAEAFALADKTYTTLDDFLKYLKR